MFTARTTGVAALAVLTVFALAQDPTIRVSTWNISNYSSGRTADIQNAVYGSFQGRQFAPDVIFGQEIIGTAGANNLVSALNGAAGSPGDWAVTFGELAGNSETAMFYRTSRINPLANIKLVEGSTAGAPRDVYRFDFSIVGNQNAAEVMSVYNVHMKSGNGTDDQTRRNIEAGIIRDNANALGSNHQIMVMGDFNGQTSSQDWYQTLTTSGANARGQFLDPIASEGSWNNNASWRFVHTQDPSGAGGMDDRFDMILMGGALGDGLGTDYVGAFGTAYSTSTWDDANHSYRAWGNDGTSFDTSLTVTGNQMVGASIAQSLINVSTPTGGHLPVFADIRYTAVPEPASMIALGLGIAALARRRSRS